MVEVTEYWEKVSRAEKDRFGHFVVIKGEYEVRSRYMVNNTLAELKNRYRFRPNKFNIEDDRIVENNGTYFGIHSYTEIKEVA